MFGCGCGRKAFDKKTIQASFTGHLTGLSQDILTLFQPGLPLPHILFNKKKKKKRFNNLGIANYIKNFEKLTIVNHSSLFGKHFINKEYQYQVQFVETVLDIKRRKDKERLNQYEKKYADQIAAFDPMSDLNVEGDPFKTLFVARLSYRVTERELWIEFEEFGTISLTRIIVDKLTGKYKGYAFIEFVRAEDMKLAYKSATNMNIGGRRIIIDVERGRTVAQWKPRRLGGGLGGEKRLTRCKSTISFPFSTVKNINSMINYKGSSSVMENSKKFSANVLFYKNKNN